MKINLKRPLCFFDLETTGINIVKDRIIEIGIVKLLPNGNTESKTWLTNPGITIPEEAIQIHGITNEDVEDSPSFKEISRVIFDFIKDSDLAGFNCDRFDIPLLAEEFLRVEIDFDLKKIKTIDVQTIFHKMEKRTLGAAYKFYCNKELVNAHSALSDSNATYEVLMSQIDRYDELGKTVSELSEFSNRKKLVDVAGFIVFDENEEPCFSFGKHKGKTVEMVLENDPGYFGWVLNADFPLYTKKILTSIRLSKLNNNS
ncbi:MAG: 3'-5' exonuclease [Flavobacteriaceae bacterium]|nr:3'-5' exonuclease [Flavobacteriaceae bacterium]|tara:strand:- start:855 stop:1628 length:774 start_codon:yes stop_codon:yes gene_type:complete